MRRDGEWSAAGPPPTTRFARRHRAAFSTREQQTSCLGVDEYRSAIQFQASPNPSSISLPDDHRGCVLCSAQSQRMLRSSWSPSSSQVSSGAGRGCCSTSLAVAPDRAAARASSLSVLR